MLEFAASRAEEKTTRFCCAATPWARLRALESRPKPPTAAGTRPVFAPAVALFAASPAPALFKAPAIAAAACCPGRPILRSWWGVLKWE